MRTFLEFPILEKEEAKELLPVLLSRIEKDPLNEESLNNLGHCYSLLGQDEKAIVYFGCAAAISSNPIVHINYAALLNRCARFEDAFFYIDKAHAELPEHPLIGYAYAEALIRQNKWLEAWPICSKYRWTKPLIAIPNVEEWMGQDIKGKHIAVITEGGQGDTFFLFRFLPKLTAMGAMVTLVVLPYQKDVGNFLENHPYIKDIPDGVDRNRPYDYWVAQFELLQWLKIEEPYWPGIYFGYRGHVTLNKPRVGLCWDCGQHDPNVLKLKSLTPEQKSRLLSNTQVNWVDLTTNSPDIKTWQDTANIIANLDLVVTMDTAVAHLAGAMGKTTWVVMGGMQGYMWGSEETTGWYPSWKLFRGDKGCFGFDSVIPKVERALKEKYEC